MKKYLLPRLGKFYKANMHTHTMVSDGSLTPEEAKAQFKSHGYSIVAFTDHEVMVPHPELRDEEFLPITSFEISMNTGWGPFHKCYHFCIYSPEEMREVSGDFSENRVWGRAKDHINDNMRSRMNEHRDYSRESVQRAINIANEEGCLVSYNHPGWSNQDYSDYTGLKGIWGVEWHNSGCVRLGYNENDRPILDLLREGERMIYPLATDDCHSITDYFGGWIQVRARSLDYATVFEALRRGDFYSSTGPEIKSLYIEDGKVVVKTSAAARIFMVTDHRCNASRSATDKPLREAEFSLEKLIENAKSAPEGRNVWFRIDVADKYGKFAKSRAYFLDELGLIK